MRLVVVEAIFVSAGDATDMQRQFSGDLVSQKGVVPKRVATVVKIYDFNGERRVVVRSGNQFP